MEPRALAGLNLTPTLENGLTLFCEQARAALEDELVALVLYGSAAEGRHRATSDVNVVLVLRSFPQERADRLREPLRVARAAIQLEPMFLLQSEIAGAREAFADKFADLERRRRVLYGPDVFAGLEPSRGAAIARLKQVLLNLMLRLRRNYVERSLREEQAVRLIADAAGPLRSCAATLLALEGAGTVPAKEALTQLWPSLEAGGPELLERMSMARERRPLPAGSAGPTLFALIRAAERLGARAERL